MMSKKAMQLALEHAKRDERHMNHAETRYWCRMYRDIAEKAIEALAEQPAQQEPVAYGMWDTMLGKGNRMMMVRLDKGQDGCTVPLYTSPPAQQEPVAWFEHNPDLDAWFLAYTHNPKVKTRHLVFGDTAPPQRTWVGLTDEDTRKINQEVWGYVSADHTRMWDYARAVEAKLKEKNT